MTGDRRPYDGYWFTTSSSGFMVREFVRLADAMRLPCAFSIHAYDATEDAVALAEWLRQFNGFICVQIGNEECAGNTPAGGLPTIPDTRRYCEQVRRLVPAMRDANPRLVFASAMMWQPHKPDLMEEAFRLTDGFVEYWDLHVGAYQPDAGKGTREVIEGFREMARRLNPETAMKAAIFEENAKIHDMRRALAHVDNLAAAREAGGFLLTSCPANALQPWRQNDNGWDQGQIFFTPDKVWLQPCAWAQKMASGSHRDLLVAANAGSQEIKVSATRDREGKSIVLHIANPSASPQPVAFDFAGAANFAIAKATVLSAPNLEAENTPEAPELVSPRDATDSFRAAPVLSPFSYTVVEMAR
jgi:alpha-L-arabinofuranosidase